MEIVIRIEIPDGSQIGIKDENPDRMEIPKVFPGSRLPLLPKVQFHCDGCGADFMAAAITSQSKCSCGTMADRAKAPEDPTDLQLCVTCGKEYKRATGGQQGTCPDCTTVRCPTCKAPAVLSEMVGNHCPACDPLNRVRR